MGLYSFLPMWLAIGAGRMSDRVGVRGPMLAGCCGIAVGAVLPRIFPGLPALFAATSLIGLSFMLFQVGTQQATGALGAPADRPRNFSLLALGYSVSGFTGPLTVGLLIDHASFSATFACLALLPLAPAAVLARGRLALPRKRPANAPATSSGVADLLRNRHLRHVFIINGRLSMAWDLHTFSFRSTERIKFCQHADRRHSGGIRGRRSSYGWRCRIARRFAEFEVPTAALFVAGGATRCSRS
jgi:MFS family permease